MNWMILSMNFDSDIHREGEREGEKRGGEKRERGGTPDDSSFGPLNKKRKREEKAKSLLPCL